MIEFTLNRPSVGNTPVISCQSLTNQWELKSRLRGLDDHSGDVIGFRSSLSETG